LDGNHDTSTGPLDDVNDARADSPSWRRIVGALLTTVAVALAGMPVTLGAAFWFAVSLNSYDTSGQGGPFRRCGPESTECDGGNPIGLIVSALLIIGVFIGAGFAGQGVLRLRSAAAGRWLMAGWAAAFTVIAASLVWQALTGPR
jgi:hypothetical protein